MIRRILGLLCLLSAIAWAAPPPAGTAAVPEKFISVDDAKAAVDRREPVLFIDVREKAQYDDLHITGAVNIPLNVLPARLGEVPRTRTVILY